MTEADREKLLMEISRQNAEILIALTSVKNHTEALKNQVGNLHDDMLLVKQRRDDHTTKIDKLAADVEALKLGAASAGGTVKGASVAIHGAWVVIAAIAAGILGLAGLGVALFKR